MARPCLLLRIYPASEKLGITSFSAEVQWVSWRTMTLALCFWARRSITLILLAVRPSVFNCSMLSGLRYFSTALLPPRPEKGVPLADLQETGVRESARFW